MAPEQQPYSCGRLLKSPLALRTTRVFILLLLIASLPILFVYHDQLSKLHGNSPIASDPSSNSPSDITSPAPIPTSTYIPTSTSISSLSSRTSLAGNNATITATTVKAAETAETAPTSPLNTVTAPAPDTLTLWSTMNTVDYIYIVLSILTLFLHAHPDRPFFLGFQVTNLCVLILFAFIWLMLSTIWFTDIAWMNSNNLSSPSMAPSLSSSPTASFISISPSLTTTIATTVTITTTATTAFTSTTIVTPTTTLGYVPPEDTRYRRISSSESTVTIYPIYPSVTFAALAADTTTTITAAIQKVPGSSTVATTTTTTADDTSTPTSSNTVPNPSSSSSSTSSSTQLSWGTRWASECLSTPGMDSRPCELMIVYHVLGCVIGILLIIEGIMSWLINMREESVETRLKRLQELEDQKAAKYAKKTKRIQREMKALQNSRLVIEGPIIG
ncbi:hypothetical protein BCR41DRAFT_400017 [Lobosporangium transversale]|uniref:Uncharacterized protein n=1 Tax=Lobosporangium transversale TaxID=64571 RepID=A0A1Y2GE44_9FUNG|nr:hypothetical protein BCR41DRAFT_400017 [Lobosporangium transversale]ORZ06819.1 hypothetical protein BCR41DRAFT_400017 [Lobosporangium transversale]|eukprot:XP_021877740.1 hypothetical protein BCR41DRAFT_400017 [Lobosporangium transversale]